MENIKFNKEQVSKCNHCIFPDTDDPKRTLIKIKGEDGKVNIFVTCPQIMTFFGRGCGRLSEITETSL